MTTTTDTATITIDRRERDVLRRQLEMQLDSDGIQLDDAESARQRREEFEDAFAILDRIGWEEEDPRETFELLADEQLRRLLKREHDDLSHHVAYEALSCKQVRERDDAVMGPGEHSREEWADWESRTQASLDRALEELYAVNRVSKRLWWKDRRSTAAPAAACVGSTCVEAARPAATEA